MENRYTQVLHSFDKGPAGSGWSLNLVDDEKNGIGIKLNYFKLGGFSTKLFEENLTVHDLIRIKEFCETALNALATPNKETKDG